MTCTQIFKVIEDWAPKEISWQKDNVGLQVGSGSRKINNILLCLELTEKVLDEAIRKNCNLIISHHPLLFQPLKKVDVTKDKNSILVERLIKNDITLYSAHTNLDNTKNGVSFVLASTLKLQNIRFLVNTKSNQYKLSVFVPEDYAGKIADVIFNSGGGIIGEYSNCSFSTPGTGTFKGSQNSNPSVGRQNEFEKVNEIKLEVIIDSWKLSKIITEIRKVHPYEEPAYDVIPVDNQNTNYGAGAIGELDTPLSSDDFLKHVSVSLKAGNLRYAKGKNKIIKRVAVCGGAGIEYLDKAISAGADAFVTADVKYHSFHDAENEILLIDAGHYETEVHSLNEVKKRIESFLPDKKIKVFKYKGSTNPVIFYNN